MFKDPWSAIIIPISLCMTSLNKLTLLFNNSFLTNEYHMIGMHKPFAVMSVMHMCNVHNELKIYVARLLPAVINNAFPAHPD